MAWTGRRKPTQGRSSSRAPAKPKFQPRTRTLPNAESIDVGSLLRAGIEAGIEDGLVAEEKKRGLMRGANQGIYVDGRIAGPCHRASHARMLGAEPPREAGWVDKHLMFDSGHANEDSWVANLSRVWDGPILREEDIPVSWRIDRADGTEAVGSGRPDIVLCKWKPGLAGTVLAAVDAAMQMVGSLPGLGRLVDSGLVARAKALAAIHFDAYVPVQALELKQASSINSVKDSMFPGGKPKLEHALQAGRYSRELGLPYQIWYSLPFVCPIPDWSFLTPQVPAQGEPGSQYIDYGRNPKCSATSKHSPEAYPTKVQPHVVGYELQWADGILHYRRIGDVEWTETVVTEERMDDYWRFTLDLEATRSLGPRPSLMDIHGQPEFWGNKTKCNYCDFENICNSSGDDYQKWREQVDALVPRPATPTTK